MTSDMNHESSERATQVPKKVGVEGNGGLGTVFEVGILSPHNSQTGTL